MLTSLSLPEMLTTILVSLYLGHCSQQYHVLSLLSSVGSLREVPHISLCLSQQILSEDVWLEFDLDDVPGSFITPDVKLSNELTIVITKFSTRIVTAMAIKIVRAIPFFIKRVSIQPTIATTENPKNETHAPVKIATSRKTMTATAQGTMPIKLILLFIL